MRGLLWKCLLIGYYSIFYLTMEFFFEKNLKQGLSPFFHDSFETIMQNAAANPMIKICYEEGLSHYRRHGLKKCLRSQGKKLPRTTGNICTLCDFVCKLSLFSLFINCSWQCIVKIPCNFVIFISITYIPTRSPLYDTFISITITYRKTKVFT